MDRKVTETHPEWLWYVVVVVIFLMMDEEQNGLPAYSWKVGAVAQFTKAPILEELVADMHAIGS